MFLKLFMFQYTNMYTCSLCIHIKKQKNALIFIMHVLQYTNLSGKKSQMLQCHKILNSELLAVKKSWTQESCIQEKIASHFLQNTVSLFFFTLFFTQKQQENWKNGKSSSTFFQFVKFFSKITGRPAFFSILGHYH